jgi:hypothetical protein
LQTHSIRDHHCYLQSDVEGDIGSTVEVMAANAEKKEVNPLALAKNWEDRIKSETDSVHAWNEAWGGLFNQGIPHEYEERKKHLEKQLAETPNIHALPKYGLGQPFKELGARDFKRKKMFYEDPLAWEEPSEVAKRVAQTQRK